MDFGDDLMAGVGLGQERNVQRFQPVLHHYLRRVRGHEEDALVGPLLLYPPGQLHPVAFGHHHVHHHQVHPSAGLAQHLEGFGPIFRLQDSIAFLAQDAVCDTPGNPLVINNENGGCWTGKWSGQPDLWVVSGQNCANVSLRS